MPPETSFDIDEIFHGADSPEMSVDPAEIVETGHRVRRRRRAAVVAGGCAAAVVALLASTPSGGLLGSDRTIDLAPATSSTARPEPSDPPTSPAVGTSVRLPSIHLPSADRGPAYSFVLEYGVTAPGKPALGVDVGADQRALSVLRVRQDSPATVGADGTIAFTPPSPRSPTTSTISQLSDHTVVVIAAAGSLVSLDLAPDAATQADVSDVAALPGTTAVVWVFATSEPLAKGDLRGAVMSNGSSTNLVVPGGRTQVVPSVLVGTDGDTSLVYHSRALDISGIRTSRGEGYKKHPSETPAGSVVGGMSSTGAPGKPGEYRIYAVLPEGATSASVTGSEGRPLTLHLTPLGAEAAVVGFVHRSSGTAPSGDLTVAWVGADGTEHSTPLR